MPVVLPGIALADGLDPIAAEDQPVVQVDALYVGDVWRNTTGGLRTGSAYLGNTNLSLAIDGERAVGLDGTTFYVDAQSIFFPSAAVPVLIERIMLLQPQMR